jgi:hypothetical protein
MRSAILQPDVPTHMFPAKIATEDSKAEPGKSTSKSSSKSTSKRILSKPKAGSKRRASETGFDEWGDAGVDDEDLALAENRGFENIDDFDDEARPNSKAPKKKQKVPNTQDDETTAQEPQQLENGKWACNHNCKDKKNCKHLCCREGLDKPRKPKTGRKERDTSADPKQTQLSMPVSKKVKAPAATQSQQTERSAPAPQRNAPKGPEMHNLNALHSNVTSNIRSVPLLSGSSSRTYKASSPIVLPRPGQPRSKTSEAARRAAQSVYSDDFDDIEDMSLFDEPAAVVAPARPSPPPQPESDMFETDFGDMLDDYCLAAKDDPPLRIPSTPQDDLAKTFSSHDFDDDIITLSDGKSLSDARKPDPRNVRQVAGKSAAPFLEASRDSAAFDLGFTKNQAHSSTIANNAIGNVPVVSKGHEPPHDTAVNRDVVEDRPTSSDSATKVFMEEFGTDLFNYVG